MEFPEADRQKLVEWMEFLELAQYFTLEQIKQNEEGVTDTTPDPALIDMFNNMIDEMFDYGRFILKQKRENQKMIYLALSPMPKLKERNYHLSFLMVHGY